VAVLVTGTGGYLGGRIAAALAAETQAGETVIALDRARADLTVPGALDTIDTAGITTIVHAAAVTKFGVDKPTAEAVNVRGTERVVQFARRCPDLERVVYLSTLYTAGKVTGFVGEEPADVAGYHAEFANYYEWSKAEAERVVLDSGLPTVIARVATIGADDDTGRVSQFNAVHNTLKLVYYGMMSLLPGKPETPVSLATADFTVAAVLALLDAELGIYHVCPDPDHTATLGELFETAFGVFTQDQAFARRGIMRPLFCDELAFADLLEGANVLRRGPVPDALASVAPFAAQLYLPKVFTNARLHKAWPGYAAPDPIELVSAATQYLVRTRWGRNS
jgi:nucleoside-diphosphate-sugar epimerase